MLSCSLTGLQDARSKKGLRPMHELVIKGGTLVSPLLTRSADVGIDGGRIAAIGEGLSGREEIDASGMLVLPGVIDAHTHMALPVAGTRSSDDFHTGTVAAAAGGVTTIVDFTVGRRETTIPEEIEDRLKDAGPAVIDYAFHAEVIGWEPGREDEFEEAIGLGVTSFKFYTAYGSSGRRTPPHVMKAAFAAITGLGGVALVHAEDEGLIDSIAKRFTADDLSRMSTLAVARPPLCEETAISQVAGIARETGCPVHIVHVSSTLGLSAVREAKRSGIDLTAETCPQYLLLTREVYEREDGHLFSAAPPLREGADNAALWDGIRRRDIDIVATDHCPFTRKQKIWRGSFLDLPYGLPGVETLLPLIYSEGVGRGILSLTDLPRILSEAPARIYGLHPRKGTLEAGSDADIVVFDPDSKWRISAERLHMNTDFSPYEGMEVTGRVAATISRGEVIYRDGKVIADPGRGKYIRAAIRLQGEDS